MKLPSLPWQPRQETSGYTTVRSDDTDSEALESRDRSSEKPRPHNAPSNTSKSGASRIWQMSLILLMVTGGFIGGYALSAFRISTSSSSPTLHRCQNPTVRQEWRSLSTQEKDAYLGAVSCLKTKPSRLGLNHTLYDDFPWVHIHKGTYTHGAAGFLIWHRYFIHTFEKALRDECGFTGHLAYWDWTLDWEDLPNSPVFSPEHGFGGNGDPETGLNRFNGSCVADGPFKDWIVPFFNRDSEPHCLSRGMLSGEALDVQMQRIKPTAVHKVLQADDYDSFNLGLEDGPHNAIPRTIRGDFIVITAPSDPIFFLHHTQLDRLWWTWQHKDLARRLWAYEGIAARKHTERASLDDVLPLGGLAPNITVREIMQTEGDILCYGY